MKLQKYRGVAWRNETMLGHALGVRPMSVTKYLRRGNSCVDYINHRLKDSTYEEYLANGCKGYYKCAGYLYASYNDLMRQLGTNVSFASWRYNHPKGSVAQYIATYAIHPSTGAVDASLMYRGVDISTFETVAAHFRTNADIVESVCNQRGFDLEAYVDWKLPADDLLSKEFTYRGVDISSYRSIAEHFGVKAATVQYYFREYNWTRKQIVDFYLRRNGGQHGKSK